MGLTTEGREWVVDKLQDAAPLSNAKMDWVGWGTGTTAENVADSALDTESAESRVQGTLSQPSSTTDRVVATIISASTQTIAETGRFNTSTKGDGGEILQQRHVFTGVPLVSGDKIEFTLDLLS